jgi:hypothetical protein
VKVSLPGETPWVVVVAIEADVPDRIARCLIGRAGRLRLRELLAP